MQTTQKTHNANTAAPCSAALPMAEATLLDFFAAQALTALVAASATQEANGDLLPEENGHPAPCSMMHLARCCGWSSETTVYTVDSRDNRKPFTLAGFIASEAFELAEAMLAEREKCLEATRK